MRFGLRALAVGAIFAAGISACSCGPDSKPPILEPNLESAPETLSYDGLCGGGSLTQDLAVKNPTTVRLNARISFEGKAADSFRIERNGEAIETLELGGNGSDVLQIVYTPTGEPGDQEAELVFDLNRKDKKQVRILLTGFLSPNPEGASLASHWKVCEPLSDPPACPSGAKDPCCRLAPDQVFMGKVGIDQQGFAALRLENSGCGDAEILSVEYGTDEGVDTPCGKNDVRVEIPEGFKVPGGVLKSSAEVQVVFQPQDRCVLARTVTVHVNDEKNPTRVFRVEGEGTAGSLRLKSGEHLDFGSVRKGEHKDLSADLMNVGSEVVLVEEAAVSGSDKDHFKLLSLEQCGAELMDFPVTVEPFGSQEEPCKKEIRVRVRYEPKGPGHHGLAPGVARIVVSQGDGDASIVPMRGNSMPKFSSFPEIRVAFGSPMATGCGGGIDCGACVNQLNSCTDDKRCEPNQRCLDSICTYKGVGGGVTEPQAVCATTCQTAERSFLLCNEQGFNDLEITSIRLVDEKGVEGGPKHEFPDSPDFGKQIFTLDRGDCGDVIPLGTCCRGSIHLLDNHGGGQSFAKLEIESPIFTETRIIEIEKHTQPVKPPVIAPLVVGPFAPSVRDPNGVTFRAPVSAEDGGISKIEWELIRKQGASKLVEGPIDPKDPDGICLNQLDPPDRCFRLEDDSGAPCLPDGSNCTVLRFFPDVHGSEWEVKATAYGTECDPVLRASRNGSVDVSQQ